MTEKNHKAMIATLAEVAGKGPMHWLFLRDVYQSYGGNPDRFNGELLHLKELYPGRISFLSEYNISEQPVVVVSPRGA